MQSGFLRLPFVISPKGPIPCSKSTWWAGVKSGRFPEPRRNGRMTFWHRDDIAELIELLKDNLDWRHRQNPSSELQSRKTCNDPGEGGRAS